MDPGLHEEFSQNRVDAFIIHPEYDKDSYSNDIAMLKLKEKLIINGETTRAIEVIGPSYKKDKGVHGIVSGWGRVTHNHPVLPSRLQAAEVDIIDFEECNKCYHGETPTNVICAARKSTVDESVTASGDSGGTLAINGKLAGIVIGNGVIDASTKVLKCPDLYVDVTEYAEWISDTIKGKRHIELMLWFIH